MAFSTTLALGLLGGAMAQVTPGASMMSSSTLKLARSYQGNDFFSGFGELPIKHDVALPMITG